MIYRVPNYEGRVRRLRRVWNAVLKHIVLSYERWQRQDRGHWVEAGLSGERFVCDREAGERANELDRLLKALDREIRRLEG